MVVFNNCVVNNFSAGCLPNLFNAEYFTLDTLTHIDLYKVIIPDPCQYDFRCPD